MPLPSLPLSNLSPTCTPNLRLKLNTNPQTQFRPSSMLPASLNPIAPVTHNRQTPTPNPSPTFNNSNNKLRLHLDHLSTIPTGITMTLTSRLGPSTMQQEGMIPLEPCTLLVYLGSSHHLVAIRVLNNRTNHRPSRRGNSHKATRARRKVNPLLGLPNNPLMDRRKR